MLALKMDLQAIPVDFEILDEIESKFKTDGFIDKNTFNFLINYAKPHADKYIRHQLDRLKECVKDRDSGITLRYPPYAK